MPLKKVLFGMLLLTALPGCQPQTDGANQSEEWYQDHRDERKEQLRKCGENPALQSSSDCLNAMAAEHKSMRNGQKELQQ